jgi:hypothetical protein
LEAKQQKKKDPSAPNQGSEDGKGSTRNKVDDALKRKYDDVDGEGGSGGSDDEPVSKASKGAKDTTKDDKAKDTA